MKQRLLSLILAAAAILAALSSCAETGEGNEASTSAQTTTANKVTTAPVTTTVPQTTIKPTTAPATTQQPTTATDKKENRAEEILSQMSLEEKVGQMFYARFPSEGAKTDAKTYFFGGYILFGKDFEDKTAEEIRDMISEVQSAAELPMLIGVDEEGGTVVRISDNPNLRDEPFGSPKSVYENGGWDAVSKTADEKSRLLKSLGVNLNMDPVCDLVSDPNSFMYDRSFSSDAEMTSKFVRLTVEGYSKNDLASVLKHFPGYGENEDTHTGTAVDNRELSELVSKDFAPFAAGIKAGADCILVSHNIINKVDEEYPASLSAKVHALIRDKLGFEGVIMTDDLIMEAITEYIGDENAAVLAVKSGNDLILSSNYEEQYPAVLDAVKTGEITEKQLDASVKRILTMKLKRGIIE